MATTHYKYGGSKMELTELCPGSIEACKPFENQSAGEAAERGQRIHEHMETALISGKLLTTAPKGLDAKSAKEYEIGVKSAIKIIEIAQSHGFTRDELRVERQLPLPQIHPDAGGTPDVDVHRAFGDLVVIDLKTGSRQVGVEESMQLAFYGVCVLQSLSAFERATLDTAHMYIVQPDADGIEIHVRKWSLPVANLVKWEDRIRAAVQRSESNPSERIAGDHCEKKYCSARSVCPVYKEYLNQKAFSLFDTVAAGLKPEAALNTNVLAEQYKILPAIKAWCKEVEETVKRQLAVNPHSVPGFGLETGLGNRTWSDEKALKALCKELKLKLDEFSPRSLVSPAEFERILQARLKTAELTDEERNRLSTALKTDMPTLTERPTTGAKIVEKKDNDLATLFAPPEAKPELKATSLAELIG